MSVIRNILNSTKALVSNSLPTTGSNTFRGTQTMSGSILPAIDNTYDLGSVTYQWRDIYVSSGSLYIDGTKVLGSTGNELQITTDVGQSIKILEAGSDSIILQSADGNIELKSSGGGNLLFDPTTGLIDVRGTLQIQDGNKITSSGGNGIVFGNNIVVSGSFESTGNINGINLTTFSSSIASTLLNQNTATSSYETKGRGIVSGSSQITPLLPSGVVSGSAQTIVNLPTGTVSGSSQVVSILSSLNTYTGSNDTTNTAQNTRLTTIESVTGSYETKGRSIVSGSSQIDVMSTTNIARLATTGSNTFRGNQSITGGDVKIGTDASASWSYPNLTALQVRNGSYYNYPGYSGLANNIYYNGGWKYYETAGAGYAEFDNSGGFSIYTAPSGVAGTTATLTQKIAMTQTGEFTINDKLLVAAQPSFVANKSSNQEPASDTILNFENATVNRGNHYNTANSRFTVPVTGVYAIGVRVWFKTGSTGTIWIHLRKNGVVFTEQRLSMPTAAADYTSWFPKWVFGLTAGDYIEVSGYGDNANFHSSQGERYTQFYGHLLH